MTKFLIYNAAGLTIPVEAEPGLPFRFECSSEECGKKVVIEGRIVEVSRSSFEEVMNEVISENSDFKPIEKIEVRRYLFVGKVNGIEAKLPAEAMADFAKRFIEGLDSIMILK
ncbi:hypothetical protein A3L09_02850 [Thermococcus profundus]|uniref:Uncharacterized protein n=2 Tax=Thermococcus profundus TaxID=49899 RepID=A0A2Z2ME51_THEPR|nr:hypothetical protein [Thermococcus profundus]ASJ02274.1 hypothetical protein A3L09_02850 [Thermococcus profundus]